MKICLKELFIFLIILCILTISAADASDMALDDSEKSDNNDLSIGNIDEINSDRGNSGNIENINSNMENNEDTKDINPNMENNEDTKDINPDTENNENIGEISLDMESELKGNNLGKYNANNSLGASQDTNTNANEGTSEDTDATTNDKVQKNDTSTKNISKSKSTKKTIVKTTPRIKIKTSKLKSRDTLVIYLKKSDKTPLKSKKINLLIDNKNITARTNSEGVANINLFLIPKTYKIKIQFAGDNELNPCSKKYKIKVTKLSTKIKTFANYVVKKKRLYIYLLGEDWKGVPNRKVILKFRKRTYVKTTNKKGYVSLKIKLPLYKSKVSAKFKGDKHFKKSSKTIRFYVTKYLSFRIGNKKLLTKGYLRIYLKGKYKRSISHRKMIIYVGKKKFIKRTNSEGIICFKPELGAKNYTVVVKFGKYSVNKRVLGIDDKVKDPMKHNISLVDGAPDLDYMPGSYVMGDEKATYTLTRGQFKEVIQRDSYCLFLNNKLSRYVFFKTKGHPKLNHIISRGKWNVIEREINKKLVWKNRHNYWPKEITVSLKGRAYKYSEVRDVQNTGYTCGPTSASVCTQVLRNYVCEKHLAKLAHTNRSGTDIPKLEKALNKNNFTCIYFYKDSFNIGLKELKKGGCALVFHAHDHYVTILDISGNGKKVLVSNSYGSYDRIRTGWVSTGYMNKKFGHFHDSLVVRLNYTLSESKKNSVNCFYHSMGTKWKRHDTKYTIGWA